MPQSREKTRINLERARSLIDNPQKWERAWPYSNHETTRRSLFNAIYDATQVHPHPTPEFRALCRALGGKYSIDRLLAYERDHNHRDIMNLFDKAISDG